MNKQQQRMKQAIYSLILELNACRDACSDSDNPIYPKKIKEIEGTLEKYWVVKKEK